MLLGHHKRAVGIFSDYQKAELALSELQTSGFPMHKVSVVATDISHRNAISGIHIKDRFDHTRFGLPPERASFYQERLSQGHYLVTVEGTEDEIRRAELILSPRGIQQWKIYDELPDARQNLVGVGKQRRAVGVFPNRRDAEQALHELRDSGFAMNRVSIIAKDADHGEQIAGAQVRERVGNKAEEGATVGAVSGGVVGGLTGLLVGLGTLAIPGIGPIMLAGAAATAIATTLSGTAIGAVAGSLLGGLIGLGIPEERARVYNERVARGEYLLILDGTDEEIAKAQAILANRGIEEYGVYDAPFVNAPVGETIPSGINSVRNKYAVGFFPQLRDAELAIDDLRNASFPLNQVSLVAQNFQRREPFTGADLSDRFDAMRIGLPDERARFYNDRVTRGEYVVIVKGTEEEIRHATSILEARGIQEWQVYDPTAIDSTLPQYTTTPTSGAGRIALDSYKRAVGLFAQRRDAELAISDLRNAGFPLSQISLVAQHLQPQEPFVGLELRDRLDAKELGFPDERARFYNDRITQGEYVVFVYGTQEEIRHAAAILSDRGIQEWHVYDPATIDYTRTGLPTHTPDPLVTGVDRHDTPGIAVSPAAHSTAPTPGVPNRAFGKQKRALGVFAHRREAEAAFTELKDSGFSMSQVSVIAKDTDHDHPIAGVDKNPRLGNQAEEGAKAGAATGGALGGIGGLLVGLGALAIPGVGPVLLGGAAATAIATAISGTAIGAAAGGLGGALVGIGIPEERARVYNERIIRGDYLVIVDGTENEIHRAESILKHHGIKDFETFDASDVDTTHRDFKRLDRDNTPSGNHPDVTIIDRRNETL